MNGALEFTVLGCGSSGGVPRADGAWGACDPSNPRNRRTRCSLLVRRKGEGALSETTVLIDTSPDLVRQTAAAGARRLDAVLLTHDHADQTHGIDDIRAFFIQQRDRIPVFMDEATRQTMLARFGYVFVGQGGYPPIAHAVALPPLGAAWTIEGPLWTLENIVLEDYVTIDTFTVELDTEKSAANLAPMEKTRYKLSGKYYAKGKDF